MLKTHNISFSYGHKRILRDVSFEVGPGEICTVIGSSGAGKTTLFRLLTGLLTPDDGTIEIAGSLQTGSCQQISYMMQEDLLLPWRTALENVALPRELGKREYSTKDIYEEASSLLNEVGLHGRQDHFPDQLSGGMKQLVSLARALIQKNPLILLDEPFSPLDVALREKMYLLLKRLAMQKKIAFLMITHDFRDALALSDRIYLLSEGTIKQEWTIPHDVETSPACYKKMHDELRHAISR